MRTMPTVENAATRFNAKTVTHRYDVIDRRTATRPYSEDEADYLL